MPYRIDLPAPPDDALDRLVALGALDVELTPGGLAALLPDAVPPAAVAHALGKDGVTVSPAHGRDDDSVWILTPRAVRTRRLLIVPAGTPAPAGALALSDGSAFGTGLHATTALCLEVLEESIESGTPSAVLDVGTGSGVLGLAALMLGVPHATALDIDPSALRIAGENARTNGLHDRLRLVQGGPDAVEGAWPLVLANVLAAPLIEMAPVLVTRLRSSGRLALSGIPESMATEVERVYTRLGMRAVERRSRSGWSVLLLQASW